ncbi:MAG: tetratricopeptide repeat protein, partial [Candidatus Aminicenantia bacterium]
ILSLSKIVFPFIEPDKDFKEGFAFLLLKKNENAKKLLEPWILRQRSSILKEAFKALLEGDKFLASSKFESFLDQDERNIEALLGYGLSLEETYPVYEEHFFRQALKINRDLSIGRIAFGYYLIKQGRLKEAEREISLAIRKDNFPVYKYFLFELYITLENWEGALKVYDDLYKSFQEDWSLHLRISRLLLKKGIREKGIELLQRALAKNPSSTELLIEMGTALAKEGRVDVALTYFERASSINKNDPLAIKGKGFALMEKGDFQNAYKELLKAWKKRQDDGELFFFLSKSAYQIGRDDEGKEWLLRAVLNGFIDLKEFQRIPLLKDFNTKEKFFSYLNLMSIPFFQVEKIEFSGSERIVLIGRRKRGEGLALFILGKNGKTIKSINLEGGQNDLYINGETTVLLASEKDDMKRNVYLINDAGFLLKLNSQPIDFYSIAFHPSKNGFYLWDREVENAITKSPFSMPVSPTKRLTFYPGITFQLYQFINGAKNLKRITSQNLSSSEFPFSKNFKLLEKLFNESKDFRKIVERGKNLDISSAETVEIFPFSGKGAVCLEAKGSEITIYMFDINGKKIKQVHYKMDAVYTFTPLDMDKESYKFFSIAESKSKNLLIFDLKKKKFERLVGDIKKFEKTFSGYLILNEKGELKEFRENALKRTIVKDVRNFCKMGDNLIFEGFDGWLYSLEGNKFKKLLPYAESFIYKISKERVAVFSPKAETLFLINFL